MLHVGDTIDHYRVLAPVDRSDLTAVVRVEHAHLGTHHALKMQLDLTDPVVVRSMLHGARLQASLDHPHLVRCTDAGEHREHPYMVTDWMAGGTLTDWLDRQGALPVHVALALFRGLSRGVRALHARRIVHRDLKPSNVLLHEDRDLRRRVPKITDLNLAKILVEGELPTPTGISAEFRTLGTPEYMAPEQAGSAGEVDQRADLWSLGIMLYEMLTNEVPFEADESWRVLVAARVGTYRPMRELRGDLPVALEELVAQLLQPEAYRRIASVEDLLAALDRVQP